MWRLCGDAVPLDKSSWNPRPLKLNALRSFQTSGNNAATRLHVPEDLTPQETEYCLHLGILVHACYGKNQMMTAKNRRKM